MPTAWFLTRIWPCPGCGAGISSSLRTDGPPYSETRIAFMGSSRAPRIPLLRLDAIYYTLTGPAQAPVVVLLHGLGSCGDDWAPQIPALIGRYRVLTLDLPGHHRSARPTGTLSIETMAAAVDALLERLGIARAHVVG